MHHTPGALDFCLDIDDTATSDEGCGANARHRLTAKHSWLISILAHDCMDQVWRRRAWQCVSGLP